MYLRSPYLQHTVTAPCLRLTFPISQGHGKIHWGIARVGLRGEISSSGCKAKQVYRGVEVGMGDWEPRMGHGDLGGPVIPHSTATGLLVARVGLDENLSSPKNVANRIPICRVPEAWRVWVFNPVS